LAVVAKAIDTFVADHRDADVVAFAVLLAENTKENRAALTALAQGPKIALPLTIPVRGKGIAEYRFREDAAMTVLVGENDAVKANIVLTGPAPATRSAQDKEVQSILEPARKMVAKQ
jgi:hypothetical protein